MKKCVMAVMMAALSFSALADGMVPEAPTADTADTAAIAVPTPPETHSESPGEVVLAPALEAGATTSGTLDTGVAAPPPAPVAVQADAAPSPQEMLGRVDVRGANGCQGIGGLGVPTPAAGQSHRVALPAALRVPGTQALVAADWATARVADGFLEVSIGANETPNLRTAQLSVESSEMLCVVELKQPSVSAEQDVVNRKLTDHSYRYPLMAPKSCGEGSACATSRWLN